jgi:mannosyltransferase OCH1-like enzyme
MKYNGSMIPKIIFQTHEYNYEECPEWFKQTSMSWRNLNPGWEYVYHNFAERTKYVKDNSPELYKIYTKVIKPHQADIWRYLIVRNIGGVYADMDSFCTVPMDYILDGLPDHIDLVSTATENRTATKSIDHTNNSNFGAIKGSKILNKCIDDIIEEDKKYGPKVTQRIIHECFSDNVKGNPDTVSKVMRAEHGASYKTRFNQDIMIIDYYGQEMTYLEFLSNHNMV